MVEVQPEYYFPDILEDVFARISQFFETRAQDTFSVQFDHGLYEQVGNDRAKAATTDDVLAWLQMPFDEDQAEDDSYATDVTCRIIIAIETDNKYTQQQREQINFFPRLVPVYERLKYELKNEPRLSNQYKLALRKRFVPFWGGGDVNAPAQNNLWNKKFDCYDISNIKLKKNNIDDGLPFTNIK